MLAVLVLAVVEECAAPPELSACHPDESLHSCDDMKSDISDCLLEPDVARLLNFLKTWVLAQLASLYAMF